MSEILLIGNSGLKHHGTDGQTAKVRLYKKKMEDEGFDVFFVDLESFSKHPISTLLKIKKGIKVCDRIVLLTAERGAKILIPYINKKNRKYNKPFVLPLIGVSVLHYAIDSLTPEQANDFIVNHNFELVNKNTKIENELKRIDYIIPETNLLADTFSKFYSLDNCVTITNFRDCFIDMNRTFEKRNNGQPLRIVFLSRIMTIKGVFDLIKAVNIINQNNIKIIVDFYGGLHLNREEKQLFDKEITKTSFNYKGQISNNKVVETIKSYDLFVFPTRYLGEGTPGVIVESLLAGIPILTSSFAQARFLLKDGFDSVFYDMFDVNDLVNKLSDIYDGKYDLNKLSLNAYESGKKFTYQHERDLFLKYVCGINIDNKVEQ